MTKSTDSQGRNRVAAGVPTGGEFAKHDRSEAHEGLLPAAPTPFGISISEIRGLVAPLSVRELTDDEAVDLFSRAALSGIAEPADQRLGQLLDSLGARDTLVAILAGDTAALARGLENSSDGAACMDAWRPRAHEDTVRRSLRYAVAAGATLASPDDEDWPEGFADLGTSAPTVLWTRGNREALKQLGNSITFSGSRASTGYGEHIAIELASASAESGLALVSGGAYGIDAAAHRGAVAAGGTSIAFLAGGVDRPYPSGNDALFDRIRDKGLLVSELPPGVPPTKWRLMQRNRLMAAASQVTVIVEAGARSGSLNIAGHAAALGRPVGAVPGPVTSTASAGSHALIRDGVARLVTNAADINNLAKRG